jgi:hypothetical protein
MKFQPKTENTVHSAINQAVRTKYGEGFLTGKHVMNLFSHEIWNYRKRICILHPILGMLNGK